MKFIQLASFFTAALASPLLPRAPVLPSQDPFYKVPANVASYRPGQVIQTRDVPPKTGVSTNKPLKRFVQVQYRTTDAGNLPTAAVASILIPTDANTTQLLAYQTAYDSANINCGPSYGLQDGANATQFADLGMIGAALNRGFYVLTSDYEGVNGGFTNGVLSGRATLDSVRATLNLAKDIGLDKKARYAMWGYSGGALASEWAAELQPSYAPELHFEGTAMGGMTPNISNVLFTINKGFFAGLAFSGISGLNKTVPDAASLYQESVFPEKKAEFESLASGCLAQAALGGGGKDLYSYFKQGDVVIYDRRFQDTVNAVGVMGTHGVPNHPIYAYKAIADEVSPVADSDNLIKKLCAGGANIEYHRDLIGEHATEALTGAAGAFSWVSDRLDGKPGVQNGCKSLNVKVEGINAKTAPAGFTPEIVGMLQGLLASKSTMGPVIGKAEY